MDAISVEGLSKHFGRRRALSDIAFRAEPGEMVALIGASGSGKSTLIRHIAGLEFSDRSGGRVSVLGREMQVNGRLAPSARALRCDVGVVFQQFNLVSRLSVLVNVLVGVLGRIPRWRGTLGLFTREEKERAREALARVGIAEVAWQRASTLSGGQQQRAAIARGLVQGAKVILADEPIASLDPSSAKRVMETLAAINREERITVLVSLHQVEYARLYCRRTIAMSEGRIVYDGPSDALTREFLAELYGSSPDGLVLPEDPSVGRPPRTALADAAPEAELPRQAAFGT